MLYNWTTSEYQQTATNHTTQWKSVNHTESRSSLFCFFVAKVSAINSWNDCSISTSRLEHILQSCFQHVRSSMRNPCCCALCFSLDPQSEGTWSWRSSKVVTCTPVKMSELLSSLLWLLEGTHYSRYNTNNTNRTNLAVSASLGWSAFGTATNSTVPKGSYNEAPL